jgi:superfamily II DNA/RNA helicase
MDFYDLPLDDNIFDALDAMNFETCTPIQEKTIMPLLEGRDLIGVAQTGTGKTAAYLLPILNRLNTGKYSDHAINCIIMSPTRELAQQIDQQVEGFAYFMPISSVAIYGGNDGIRFEQERKGLKLGADIIIATPGRLISHLATGNIDLSHVAFFVLDEADRMLDMGFYDDIMKIVKMLPEERQTIMFSATMPENIQKLAHNILNNPVEVKIAVSKPADKIKQTAYMCHENMKPKIMAHILKDNSHDKIIIFASSKQKVKELYAEYSRKGFNVGEIHSDLLQSEREKIMYDFKNNHIKILIATDIISRGIDIDDIQLVINYDVPRDPEDYVHRIGRTARANRTGEAITLVSSKDYQNLVKIEKLIEKEIDKPDLFEGCGEKLDINKLRQDHKAANKKGKRGNNASEKKHKKPRRHNQHSKKRSNEPSN